MLNLARAVFPKNCTSRTRCILFMTSVSVAPAAQQPLFFFDLLWLDFWTPRRSLGSPGADLGRSCGGYLDGLAGLWGGLGRILAPRAPRKSPQRRHQAPRDLAKVAAEGPRAAPGGPRETKKHPQTHPQKSEEASQEKNYENQENDDPLERNAAFSGLQSRKSRLEQL